MFCLMFMPLPVHNYGIPQLLTEAVKTSKPARKQGDFSTFLLVKNVVLF